MPDDNGGLRLDLSDMEDRVLLHKLIERAKRELPRLKIREYLDVQRDAVIDRDCAD